jgi:hypothetical protein
MNGPWFIAITPGLNVFVSLSAIQSGPSIVLSWPTNAVGFKLQTASALPSVMDWIDSTNAPAIVDSQFNVTNPLVGTGHFFRLIR